MTAFHATRGLFRASLAALALTFSGAVSAAGTDGAWVRIHHPADTPALHSIALQGEFDDYGSFLWGRTPREDIEKLRERGLSVTVSRNPFQVTLGSETFDPLDMSAQRDLLQADPDGGFHLVQLSGPIRPSWVRQLRTSGVQVVQPLHPFSYYVWGNASQINAMRSVESVRAVLPVQPDWKVQPHLRELDAEFRPTMALASNHTDQRALERRLREYGRLHRVTPLNRHFSIIHMDVRGSDYRRLAGLDAIYTVQYISQDAGPRGEMSNQSIVGGIDGGSIQTGYLDWLNPVGFDGSGVTVGIVDGGVQESHPDLTDNIVPCTGSQGSCTGASSSHGTHVAGAVGGTGASGQTDGNGFLRGQGVAPGASLVNQEYDDFLGSGPGGMVPDGMLSIFRDSADSGALLTNNSWGPTGSPQGYDIPTQQIDYISRDADPDTSGHQPVLAVWSIMNGNGDGGGSCSPSSLGSPDEAKNLFGVGSTGLQGGGGSQLTIDEVFSISGNSAHGPACDGRRVPDIVAPGCSTDSTDTGSSWGLKCGTSMASPVVSGAIAVWAESYIAATGNNPSPAMMKAAFIAVARDLEGGTNADGGTLGHRPDRFQGYGRLDFDAVMNPAGDHVYLYDQETVFTASGQDWGLTLNAADPSEPMKIVLTWTDAPGHGLGGTAPAWVNDLDLQVDALDGNTYLGNVVGSDGWSDTGGSPDGMNNTEAVWLQPSQHQGGFDLTVLATDIAGDALNPYDPGDPSQDFSVACYNCIVGNPTFTLDVTPDTLEACVPESGTNSYDLAVNVSAVGAYTGTVDLTTSGEPGGVSSIVDPDSVPVPGSSTWTVTVADSASAGSSTLAIEGDDGSDMHSVDITTTLEAFLSEAPAPIDPVDGAADISLTPTFAWNNLGGVDEYRIQIATDAGFGNLVVDEAVLGASSFVPSSELNTGTEYFWRVQGANLCGGGDWSSTRSFTTRLEPMADFSQSEFNFSIPQSYTDGATLQLANVGTGNLTFDIRTDDPQRDVSLNGTHDPARDEILVVDNFTLPGSATVSDSAEGGVDSTGQVVGFSFEGTVSGISGVATWASDMAMTITSPEGAAFIVGGYDDPSTADWEFQGSASNNDGTYTSTHIGDTIFGAEGTSDDGSWQFDFEHTWNDTMDWTDVTVTLHKQAPPYCGEQVTTPDWLAVTPGSGSIAQGDSQDISISIDTSGMAEGEYLGYVCFETNAEGSETVGIPINLTVTGFVEDAVFEDQFMGNTR